MNKNIDLCEILRDCPVGTEFWSPISGELILLKIEKDYKHIIFYEKDKPYIIRTFNSKGYYYYNDDSVECLIFPSKDQRDWSKFKKSRFDPKTLKPFDKVLVKGQSKDDRWVCNIFSFYNEDSHYCFECLDDMYANCVPYNEETKYLVGTTEEEIPEYYRYWDN